MFIEIANELSAYLQRTEIIDILRLAADTMREGRHFVCTENREFAEQIVTTMKVTDSRTACFFLGVCDRFSEIAGQKHKVTTYLSIVWGDRIERNGNCIKVGHKIASNSNFWRPAQFIVEYLDDAKTYEAITNTLKGIPLNFEPVPGGGAPTYAVVEEILRENYIVFTIVDSDKHFPNADLGQTAMHILDSKLIRRHLLHELLILNVCEVENLFFSKSIWNDFMNDAQSRRISSIAEDAERKESDIRRYMDVKSGMSYKQFDSNSYIKNAVTITPPNCPKRMEHDGICQKCDKCTCRVIQGIGRYTSRLTREKDFIDKMHGYYEGLPPFIAEDWNNVAEAMSTWACGKKIAVVECR